MDRVPISSSNIRSLGFDSATMTLEVQFMDGRVYQYLDVPKSVYQGLLDARSAGRFVLERGRDSYRFVRL
jgi:hypothetical protein